MSLKNKYFFIGASIIIIVVLLSFYFQILESKKSNKKISSFKIETNDIYQIKSSSSPFTVIIFFDLDCEYCQKLHDLIKINTHRLTNINVILRNYPLLENGKSGYKSLAQTCVYQQNSEAGALKYIDTSYEENHSESTKEDSFKIGELLVEDKTKYKECLNDISVMNEINAVRTSNLINGISYVPSIVVLDKEKVLKIYDGLSVRAQLEIINYYNKLGKDNLSSNNNKQ